MANSVALIFLAVYVMRVVYNGKAPVLLTQLSSEKNFIPWLLSVAVLIQVKKTKVLGEIGNGLLVLLFIGMILTNGQKFFDVVKTTFSQD